ncbi:hypothetical protein F511_09272 [Dorcoceras hygrometricum]|uniref:Uncharacterized protein n=1 Tax=Dorcoceras hygrometricum TaxID=472368 RepID=A0A2Z7AUJ2_9LAMI|nr:hypothetical protein F511_09272 [Dorcoceras hygrometricum]
MGCPGQARTKPRRKINRRNDAEKHAGRRPPPPCCARHKAARGAWRAMRPAVAQQIAPVTAHSGLPAAPSITRPCAKAAASAQRRGTQRPSAEASILRWEDLNRRGDQDLNWRTLSFFNQSEMASSLFTNTVHICFDSVLAMDNPGFFENASVRDGVVISTVGGKQVEISEELFASSFELPVDGLTYLSDVPKDIVFDARSIFSLSGEQVSSSSKKREMKIEFRLLSDILAKTISVKVGSFDAVTRERCLMMVAINDGVKINWRRLLFNIFKDMVTPGSKQAKGYAIQICLLLKNVPLLALGDSKEFPASKILTDKTVHRYIAVNDKIEVEDVSRVKKTPVKRAVYRKRPAAVDKPKRKRRLALGSDDEIVQEPTAVAVVAIENPVPADADVVDEGISTADDVDNIIEQVTAETAQLETEEEVTDVSRPDSGDQEEPRADEMEHWLICPTRNLLAVILIGELKQPVILMENRKQLFVKQLYRSRRFKQLLLRRKLMMNHSLEETLLKISKDSILPSAVGEITKIQFNKEISIKGFNEWDCFYAKDEMVLYWAADFFFLCATLVSAPLFIFFFDISPADYIVSVPAGSRSLINYHICWSNLASA